MEWIYHLCNFLIGSCLASHATVICDRFDNANFVFARSRCANCLTELSLLDEIPILSYFLLHGQCRYCKSNIPIKLPIIEVLGGFAFYNIDFSQIHGLYMAVIVFDIMLCAISDFEKLEFYLVMIFPACFLTIINISNVYHFQIGDFVEFVPVILILSFYIWHNKFGGGDLIIYLILAIFFSPHFANLTFLFGSIFLLLQFLLERKTRSTEKAIAFVPYIFLGLIMQLLI